MSRSRIGALLAVAAIAVTACSGSTATQAPSAAAPSQPARGESSAPSSSPAAGTPKQGGSFVVALPGDLNRTDMALIDDANSSYIGAQVMETLVTLAPGTGDQIVPALASEYKVSDDGLTYTFT